MAMPLHRRSDDRSRCELGLAVKWDILASDRVWRARRRHLFRDQRIPDQQPADRRAPPIRPHRPRGFLYPARVPHPATLFSVRGWNRTADGGRIVNGAPLGVVGLPVLLPQLCAVAARRLLHGPLLVPGGGGTFLPDMAWLAGVVRVAARAPLDSSAGPGGRDLAGIGVPPANRYAPDSGIGILLTDRYQIRCPAVGLLGGVGLSGAARPV